MRCSPTISALILGLTALSAAVPAHARKKAENFNSNYRADEDVKYRVDPNKPNDPNYAAPYFEIAPKQETVLPSGRTTMEKGTGQTDAFETAAEQGVFLEAYQKYYGPYGENIEPKERQQLLKNTAGAIQDCLDSQNCSDTKKQLMLKALVNYNLGQRVKSHVLTNNTNRENMRSYDEASGPLRSDSDKMWEGLRNGGTKRAPRQVRIESNTTKDPVYQLDEAQVRGQIDERMVLGNQFVQDYQGFLENYTASERGELGDAPYYKYVAAKEGGKTQIYAPEGPRGREFQNHDRMSEVRKEQRNKNIQEIAGDYMKGLQAPTIKRTVKDGKPEVVLDGFNPDQVGMRIDHMLPKLDADGKPVRDEFGKQVFLDREGSEHQIVKNLNKAFQETAKKDREERDVATRRQPATASAGASMSGPAPERAPKDIANEVVNVTLSQEKFDSFLDEIWPSAAQRKKLLAQP